MNTQRKKKTIQIEFIIVNFAYCVVAVFCCASLAFTVYIASIYLIVFHDVYLAICAQVHGHFLRLISAIIRHEEKLAFAVTNPCFY